jgi:hypothetical protein
VKEGRVKRLDEMSDEELIELARQLYDSIYVSDCYGVSDLVLYYAVIGELARRGYEVVEEAELVIERAEGEGE